MNFKAVSFCETVFFIGEKLKFEVTILGCGSATPTLNRAATAQYVNARERYFLIDCAEGTQLQLRRYKAQVQRLHAIFISHLHGDHYLGLTGLLSTMHLLGRKKALHLYGPEGLMEILKVHWHQGKTILGFPLEFVALQPDGRQELYSDSQVMVSSFPVRHRIECWGFRIEEKPLKRKLVREAIDRFEVPIAWRKRVVEGADFVKENGAVIPNSEMTIAPRPPKAYAYSADTLYDVNIVPHIREVDLLYHEATFATDLEYRARETFHSTAAQAAQIAKMAEVKRLVIGHYSARYKNTEVLVNEAREYFPETTGAEDGMCFTL